MSVGLSRTDDHYYYWNGEGPYPGVTTVQKVLDSSGPLVGWAKREVAACAIRNLDHINGLVAAGQADEARKWLSKIPDYIRDKAADLGTRVHTAAEMAAHGRYDEVEEDVLPFLGQYLDWRDDWRPEYLAVEYRGVNLTHRYGGTGDLIVRSGGESWCLDIKTGAHYPETVLQLVACARFELIGAEGDPRPAPVPAVDRYGVLSLRPDGWKVDEYRVDPDAVFDAFTHLAALWWWRRGLNDPRHEHSRGIR